MGKINKERGLYIRLTTDEDIIVKKLKKNYSINMSQYLRNQIVKLGEKLKNNIGDNL